MHKQHQFFQAADDRSGQSAFCPNCGQPITATDEFCANCGFNLKAAATSQAATTTPASSAQSTTSPLGKRHDARYQNGGG